MKNSREPAVELFRVLLMYGIVVLHAAYHSIGPYSAFHTGLLWCVNAFVLITGWYGTSFSFRKIVRLYCLGLFCTGFALSAQYLYLQQSYGAVEFGLRWFKAFTELWFLHGYVLMLCLVPLVNSAIEEKRWKILLPFVLVVFAWGFAGELPFVNRIVPKSAGVGSYSGLTLLGVYIVGRWMCQRGLENVALWKLVIGLALLLLIDTAGLGWCGHYCSPFAMATAGCAFLLVKRIQLHRSLAWLVGLIAPSMFSVYLLHCNDFTFGILVNLTSKFSGNVILASMLIFLTCLCIDLGRRLMVYLGWQLWARHR